MLRNKDVNNAGNGGQFAAATKSAHQGALISNNHQEYLRSTGSWEAFQRLSQRLGPPRAGMDRFVFIDEDCVYKIHHRDEGATASNREANAVKRGEFPTAPAQWIEFHGAHVLRMDRVEPMAWDDPDMPDWADWIDARQVGRLRDGSVVAYDL